MTRHLTFIGVALVLIITLLSAWAIWRGKVTAPSPEDVAVVPPGEVGTFEIYTNGTFGFSVMYPSTATVMETFEPRYHLPSTWRANALPSGTGEPIVAIVTYTTESDNSYPRYYVAQVRIGASSDPAEVARCTELGVNEGETALPEVTLGGTTFKAFAFQSAGMMQYVKGVSYRAVHEGSCIAVEKVAAGSNYRDDPASERDITDEVLESEYEALSAVVESFSFARP